MTPLGITCPACGHDKQVVYDSRHHTDGAKLRRRKCCQCNFRFVTHERTHNRNVEFCADLAIAISSLPLEKRGVVRRLVDMLAGEPDAH